jgi:chorismate dehydratase
MALVPVIDALFHADLDCLPFGMACRQRSDSILLKSKVPIEEVKKIYTYGHARTSLYILKILCQEVFGIRPQFFSVAFDLDLKDLDDDCAILAMQWTPEYILKEYRYHYDLVSLWYKQYHVPTPLLIWAAGKGVLDRVDQYQLQSCLFAGVKNAEKIALHLHAEYNVEEDIAKTFVAANRRYYYDEFAIAGLRHFEEKLTEHGFLSGQLINFPKKPIRATAHITSGATRYEKDSIKALSIALEAADKNISARDSVRIAKGFCAPIYTLPISLALELALFEKSFDIDCDQSITLTIPEDSTTSFNELRWLISTLAKSYPKASFFLSSYSSYDRDLNSFVLELKYAGLKGLYNTEALPADIDVDNALALHNAFQSHGLRTGLFYSQSEKSYGQIAIDLFFIRELYCSARAFDYVVVDAFAGCKEVAEFLEELPLANLTICSADELVVESSYVKKTA